MDHEEKIEKLNQLADELHAAGNARPYDPDNYNRIVDELNALHLGRFEPSTRPAIPKPKSKWILQDFFAPRRLKEILKKMVTR